MPRPPCRDKRFARLRHQFFGFGYGPDLNGELRLVLILFLVFPDALSPSVLLALFCLGGGWLLVAVIVRILLGVWRLLVAAATTSAFITPAAATAAAAVTGRFPPHRLNSPDCLRARFHNRRSRRSRRS